jgi:hypothetical protein
MLLADGWKLKRVRNGRCQVSKGSKHRGFALNVVLTAKYVKSYADASGWDAKRFEELRYQVIPVQVTQIKPRTSQSLH